MSKLVFIGGYGLTNARFTTNFDGTRLATPVNVQDLPLARANGSQVVNTRFEAKEMSLSGVVKGESGYSTDTNLQHSIDTLSRAFTFNDEKYLRIVNEYDYIVDGLTVDPFTGNSHVGVSSLDATTGTVYQTGNSSILITTTTATTIVVEYDGDSVDLTGKFGTTLGAYNLESIVEFTNSGSVSSVQIKVGSDSSNYYLFSTNTDHQGYAIHNGPNIFSVPSDGYDTEVGSVNDGAISYAQLIINRLDDDGDNLLEETYLDSIMMVGEDNLRNYPCYRRGSVSISGRHHENDVTNWQVDLLNAKGYAISTRTYGLFEESGITSTTYLTDIRLGGTYEPLPLFTVNMTTATDITALEIKNVDNGEAINIIPSTITSGDIVRFGGVDKLITNNGQPVDFEGRIPSFSLGYNDIRLFVGNNIVTTATPATPITATSSVGYNIIGTTPSNSIRRAYMAQAFTVPSDDDITAFSIWLDSTELIDPNDGAAFSILGDDNGEPDEGNVMWSNYIPYAEVIEGENIINGINISVTSGSKYHLRVRSSFESKLTSSLFYTSRLRWERSGSDAYAGHLGHYGYEQSSSPSFAGTFNGWTAYPTDFKFEIRQSSSPDWDIDVAATYRKLYQN